MNELKVIGDLHVVRATWAMFVSDDKFAQENYAHYERGLKRSELLSRLPAEGKLPHPSSKEGIRLYSDEARATLRRELRNTFAMAAFGAGCAVGIAVAAGEVHPSLPWHVGKVLQTVGGVLALWGTLFALRGPVKTWGGGSAPERVHGFLFTCLLGAGGSLALLGTLL